MASALEALIGTTVVDGKGQTVAVSSLAGNDKVLGQYNRPSRQVMLFILHMYSTY